MNTIPKLFLLLILASVTSCSPSARLNRLISHHPELKILDTIVINDTIPIPQLEVDTIVNLNSLHDTLVLQKDRLDKGP